MGSCFFLHAIADVAAIPGQFIVVDTQITGARSSPEELWMVK